MTFVRDGSWSCSGAVLAAVLTVLSCSRPAGPGATQPADSLNAAGADSAALPSVITQRTAVFMEAAQPALDSMRKKYSEDDYFVMADDMMYYRATAYEYLESRGVHVVRTVGRAPLNFVVDGLPRSFDFSSEPTLDLVVMYEPGKTPVAIAPVEIERATDYFGLTPAPDSAGPAADAQVGLVLLRTSTAPFFSLDSAVAAGYPRTVESCLVHEHHGAMGYHHVNQALMDGSVEIDKPEILLYEKLASGEYRLNGVEYVVPYTAWSRDTVPPRVLGETMHQEDNLQFWYLHVWAWKQNPDGLFANFHPDVQCPGSASRVFRPGATPMDSVAPS